MKRPPAMIATMTASSGQRVSRTSSLWIFRTVLKPMSGSNRPQAMRAAIAASRHARIKPRRSDASSAISHFLHVRSPEQTLRQEDHGNRENGKGGDILIVSGEVGRPQGFD